MLKKRARLAQVTAVGLGIAAVIVASLGIRGIWITDGLDYQSFTAPGPDVDRVEDFLIGSGEGAITFERTLYRGPKYVGDRETIKSRTITLTHEPSDRLGRSALWPQVVDSGGVLPSAFTKGAPGYNGQRIVFVPVWMIFVLIAAIPAARLHRWLKRRRRLTHGRCVVCGYDLRASGDQCPECGASTVG